MSFLKKALILFLTMSLCLLPKPVMSEDLEEVKATLDELSTQVELLETQIKLLKDDKKTESKSSSEKYFLSRKGAKFAMGGKFEIQYVDAQSGELKDATGAILEKTEERDPYSEMKFELKPRIAISDNVRLYAKLKFKIDKTTMEEGYVIFTSLPLNTEFKIGLDDRFMKPSRDTENYPLAGTAFWRDEARGLFFKSSYESFYGHLSFTDGYELAKKQSGEDSSFKMMHDNTRASVGSNDFIGMKEIGAGLGYNEDLGFIGKIDILGFAYFSSLGPEDIKFLKSEIANYTSNENKQRRKGANLNWKHGGLNIFAHYVSAIDGELRREAWYVEPSYNLELPFEWNRLNKYTLMMQYGRYDVMAPLNVKKPTTWDRKKTAMAILTEVADNTTLKLEYGLLDEKTGLNDVDNDEFLMVFEVTF